MFKPLPHLRVWQILLLCILMMHCSTQKVAVSPTPPQEQEIIRLRRSNQNKDAVLLGKVYIYYNSEKIDLVPSAIIALDGKLLLADAEGSYNIKVYPGIHKFQAGTIGMYNSLLNLVVERGDSTIVNFYLKPDLRPLN